MKQSITDFPVHHSLLQAQRFRETLRESLLNRYSLTPAQASWLCEQLGRAQTVHAGEELTDTHAPDEAPRVLLEGWAAEQVVLENGRRHFIRFMFPGDILISNDGASSVIALTTVVDAPLHLATTDTILASRLYGAIAEREGKDLRVQVVRLGCLTGAERLAQLLLEIYERLEQAGLAEAGIVPSWPLTQEMLADAVGLTAVHINRLVHKLRDQGLILAPRGSNIQLNLEKLKAFVECDGHLMPTRAETGGSTAHR